MTSEISLNGNTTFTLTADAGDLEWQARRLVVSIRHRAPDADLVIFIPEPAAPKMHDLAFFETHATVVYGDIPLPEYPISAFLQAFIEGTRRADTEFVVALDTDTIALNEMTVPDTDADLWVRPAEVGAQYWGSSRALSDWEVLFDHFDAPKPSPTERVTTVIDHRRMIPYWNSGVVVTRDRWLATEWLDITQELATTDSLPIADNEFFLDQIALAIATRTRNVDTFETRMNYPLGGMVSVPSDVQIVHYGETRNLGRVLNLSIRKRLRELDAIPSVKLSDLVHSGLDLLSFKSGLVLSYEQKNTIRDLVHTLPE